MLKTTINDAGEWVQVPAQLERQAGKWWESINGVLTRKHPDRRTLPAVRLDAVCYTPDDQRAFEITAPWWKKPGE